MTDTTLTKSSSWTKLLPVWVWLRTYNRTWFLGDIVAGVTLAAYLLPSAIGDASLAQLPAEMGIYACLFSGLVFWLFCSSRHTSITVTSAISLLVGSTLGTIAEGDVSRFAALASATALSTGAIALIAWLIKAGSIVNFISETVLLGFKTGIALVLISTQLPKLFGFVGSHGDFWERAHHFFKHLSETNAASIVTGLVSLAVLVLGKLFLKNKPVALFVVISSITVATLFHLDAYGVKLLGTVPEGLPVIELPWLGREEWNAVIPLSLACFILSAVETAAIGRMFATKHGGHFDSNQEFLALAGANLAAGIGHGFPVGGGMSQSLVNESSGARSPLSGLIAASVMLFTAVYLSPFLSKLPQPVLAAIVLVAVFELLKFSELKHLWRTARGEFIVATAALLGVLGSGVLHGVLIGAIISLLVLIRRAAHPHVAILGRIPGTQRYTDIARHSDNERISGVMICRPEAGLVYFNVDGVCEKIVEAVRAETPSPKIVICDLSASSGVDIQSAHTLERLHLELKAINVHLQIVEALSNVRDVFRAEGLDEKLGPINRHTTVADSVEKFQQSCD